MRPHGVCSQYEMFSELDHDENKFGISEEVVKIVLAPFVDSYAVVMRNELSACNSNSRAIKRERLKQEQFLFQITQSLQLITIESESPSHQALASWTRSSGRLWRIDSGRSLMIYSVS